MCARSNKAKRQYAGRDVVQSALFQRRRTSGIGITPLIDVVFILLLFFMLTSTFSHYQTLDLVNASAADSAIQPVEQVPPLLLVVSASMAISVGDSESKLTEGELQRLLSDSIVDGQIVLVSAGSGASVQDLVSVVEKLKSLGVERLDIVPSVQTRREEQS